LSRSLDVATPNQATKEQEKMDITTTYILALLIAAIEYRHLISVIGKMRLKIDFEITARR